MTKELIESNNIIKTLISDDISSEKLYIDELTCYKNTMWKIYFSKDCNVIEIEKPIESFRDKYIEVLKKLAPILLENRIFIGSDLIISEKKISITTTTNRVIDLTNYIDDNSKNLGIEIIKNLAKLNIGDGEYHPICFENPFDAIRKGIKISCIKGEETPYIHHVLVKICKEKGISPISGKKFKLEDIVEFNQDSTLELPINTISKNNIEIIFSKITKRKRLDTIDESNKKN